MTIHQYSISKYNWKSRESYGVKNKNKELVENKLNERKC